MVLGAVYDMPSGALMAQDIWQADSPGSPGQLAG